MSTPSEEAGRTVVAAYDNDRAGRDGAQKLVALLDDYGALVFVVDVATAPHGEPLTPRRRCAGVE